MTNERKSFNLVKSHELICHLIRLYLVPLPPYIQGTDGSTFHPDIKKDETIHIFNRDLCRSLPLVYQKDVIDGNGIPGYRFVLLKS